MQRLTSRHTAPRGLIGHIVLIAGFLYLPVGVLILFSVSASSNLGFPIQALTLDWYTVLFSEPKIYNALFNSLIVALITAVIVVGIATLTAYALTQYNLPGRWLLAGLVLLPIVVPKSVLGIALMAAASRLGVPTSLATVTLGHVLFCFPFVTIVIGSVMLRVDPRTLRAAMDLGATEWTTFRRVVLPLTAPGLVAGALVSIVLSLSEFNLSFFLSGREQTLPLVILSEFHFEVSPKINALSTLIVLGNVLLIVAAEALRSRYARRRLSGPA
jgi:spermidine/putrescine transport system permease protein